MLFLAMLLILGVMVAVIYVIGATRKGHVFHSPESYSYNEDGSLRKDVQRHD